MSTEECHGSQNCNGKANGKIVDEQQNGNGCPKQSANSNNVNGSIVSATIVPPSPVSFLLIFLPLTQFHSNILYSMHCLYSIQFNSIYSLFFPFTICFTWTIFQYFYAKCNKSTKNKTRNAFRQITSLYFSRIWHRFWGLAQAEMAGWDPMSGCLSSLLPSPRDIPPNTPPILWRVFLPAPVSISFHPKLPPIVRHWIVQKMVDEQKQSGMANNANDGGKNDEGQLAMQNGLDYRERPSTAYGGILFYYRTRSQSPSWLGPKKVILN